MRIDAELADVARYGGFFAIGAGEAGRGWRPISHCHADGFADLLERTARRYGTADLRVAASQVQFSVASRLWSPAIACAVTHGVVPDFTDLYRADGSAELLLHAPGGVAADSEEEMVAQLYESVVERQLAPLAAGLRVKIATGLLDGNAASAMVAATRAWYGVRPQVRDRATRVARALLTTGRLNNTGTVKGNLAFRRRSCCLYYRVPGGSKCGDCGIIERGRTTVSTRRGSAEDRSSTE